MQHPLALALCAAAIAGAPAKENSVANPPLMVEARCQTGTTCIFNGTDVPIEVTIVNTGAVPVGFPLAFRQTTGPSIRLVDRRSDAERTLRTNLASLALADEFTQIPPGGSARLTWVIKRSEIQAYVGGAPADLDLTAEITVACKVQVGGQVQDYSGSSTLHIVGSR
jgi:hypothetical protein